MTDPLPTIDDVAARAGVSRSTVSLVINDRASVRPDTAEVVLQAMRELDYQPASPGRRRGQRDRQKRATNRIALLAAGMSRGMLNAPVYMNVLYGVESAVRDRGKVLVLTHLPPNTACPSTLFTQRVDGVVVFGQVINARLAKMLRPMSCTAVMGPIDEQGTMDHVSYDNAPIGRVAADHLLQRGCRRAAFVAADQSRLMLERGKVFRQAMSAAGGEAQIQVDEQLLDEQGDVQQVRELQLRALVDQLLAVSPRLDGLFLAADTLAPAIQGELIRRGIMPGEHMEIISCNNELQTLAHLQPRPATIDIHAEQVGRRAVDQLLWRIDHPNQPRVTTAIDPTLVIHR